MSRVAMVLALGVMLSGPSAPASAAEGLERAFQKEFMFLETQKRELENRLAAVRRDNAGAMAEQERKVRRLEAQVLTVRTDLERANELLMESERQLESVSDGRGMLEATYEQATASLRDWGRDIGKDPLYASATGAERLHRLFGLTNEVLDRGAAVSVESGRFFLSDGTRTEGRIVRVGRVAAYGVADGGAGMLAPAGAGEFKLWKTAAAPSAQAMLAGSGPEAVDLFLFENTDRSIDEQQEKGVVEVIGSGGVIGWVIVGLGALALLMVMLRSVFLRQASTNTGTVLHDIDGLVSKGHIQEALAICERVKGSTGRVVAATLRNLDREREHLEDIVSESILNESPHLNRFGAMIMVIAAVSPLLGLLGTVTGMIGTFDVITEFGTGDPKLLSGGISVALVTTQLGLIVAIPTLIFGNLLAGWSNRIKDDMEKAALRVINLHERAA